MSVDVACSREGTVPPPSQDTVQIDRVGAYVVATVFRGRDLRTRPPRDPSWRPLVFETTCRQDARGRVYLRYSADLTEATAAHTAACAWVARRREGGQRGVGAV